MTDYPTPADRKKALREKRIYCKEIKGCNEAVCCYFCKDMEQCHISCSRTYWTSCRLLVGQDEITWLKIFGEDPRY